MPILGAGGLSNENLHTHNRIQGAGCTVICPYFRLCLRSCQQQRLLSHNKRRLCCVLSLQKLSARLAEAMKDFNAGFVSADYYRKQIDELKLEIENTKSSLWNTKSKRKLQSYEAMLALGGAQGFQALRGGDYLPTHQTAFSPL